MRRQALLVMAMAALLATPALADNLEIDATPEGVKVQEDRFSATATYASYDEAKNLLTLAGTEKSPVKFVFNNGKNQAISAVLIKYQLKTGRLSYDVILTKLKPSTN